MKSQEKKDIVRLNMECDEYSRRTKKERMTIQDAYKRRANTCLLCHDDVIPPTREKFKVLSQVCRSIYITSERAFLIKLEGTGTKASSKAKTPSSLKKGSREKNERERHEKENN